MLIRSGTKLEEIIILLLAGRKSASAAWLQDEIGKKVRRFTHQAIYKELAKLQKEGIIIKVSGEYSLKLSWIVDMISFTEKLSDTHINPKSLVARLSEEGSKVSWHFNNLLKMDDFWAHILIQLFEETDASMMYEWLPHPWFELVHRDKEDQFRRALKKGGRKVRLIIGGREYLDEACEDLWSPEIYEYSFANSPFEAQRSQYLDVIGDYILTIKVPKRIADKMDALYMRVNSEKDFAFPDLLDLLTQKTKIKVVLEHNTKKASRLTNKFERFFG